MERPYLSEASSNVLPESSVRLRSGSRADVHVLEQLKVQRKNMGQVCKMCVKSIVDKSPFEAITDDCPHMNNLCNVLEHMFLHRIQARWSIFSSTDPIHFWHIIQQYAPPVTVGTIDDIESITSELGKCRAWLRLSLVQKKLAKFMNELAVKQNDLKVIYMHGAFMTSQELPEVAGVLKCLDGIDFSICLRDQDFDFDVKYEINYSPYLVFQQSNVSQIDDLREEQRLISNGMSSHIEEREGVESTGQLRDLLTTEREQKNYYEELVSVRDGQINRLQKEVDELSRENEKQKKESDSIILELQEQLSKLQNDLRQQRGQRARTSSNTANRRSGFFSSIFGSGDT